MNQHKIIAVIISVVLMAVCFICRADVFSDAIYLFRGGRDANQDGYAATGDLFNEMHADQADHASHSQVECSYGYSDGRMFRTEKVVFPSSNSVTQDLQCLYIPALKKTSESGTKIWAQCYSFYKVLKDNVVNDYTIIMRLRRDAGYGEGADGKTCRQNVIRLGYGGPSQDNVYGVLLDFVADEYETNSDGSGRGSYLRAWMPDATGKLSQKMMTNTRIPTNSWFDLCVRVKGNDVKIGVARAGNVINNTATIYPVSFSEYTVGDGRLALKNSTAWNLFAEAGDSTGMDITATSKSKSSFTGSCQQIAIWNRALSDDEIYEAWGAPRPALMRIGVVNGTSSEFGGVRSASAQTFNANQYWRDNWTTMQAGDVWTFNVPVAENEAGLSQAFIFKATSDSGLGTLSLSVNGTHLSNQRITSGGQAVWYVKGKNLKAGNNVLSLTSNSGSADIKLDAVSLEGSFQVGVRNKTGKNLNVSNVANEQGFVQHSASANPNHWSRGWDTYNAGTNQNLRVWFSPALVASAKMRFTIAPLSYPILKTFTGAERVRMSVNGHEFAQLAPVKLDGLYNYDPISYDLDPNWLRAGWNDFKFETTSNKTGYFLNDFVRIDIRSWNSGLLLLFR